MTSIWSPWLVEPGNNTKAGRNLSEFLKCQKDLVVAGADQLRSEISAKKIQVAIDFTSPEASLNNARILAEKGIHLVIGTTGFNNMQLFELKNLVHQFKIGLVYAPNLSVGINLLLSLVKTITRLIPQYDVEITESCHRNKKDSPSGTALKIAGEISAIRKSHQGKNIRCGRKGNSSRNPEKSGFTPSGLVESSGYTRCSLPEKPMRLRSLTVHTQGRSLPRAL